MQTTEARGISTPLPTSAPAALAERPVVRCPRCRMVQYRTAMNRCRRCYLPLALPAAAPPPPQASPRPNVAAGVKCWRQMRGLTQKQLAGASHLPRTYISRIENGRIIPGLLTLERVAGALGVTLPVLLVPSPNGSGAGNGLGEGSGKDQASAGNGNSNRSLPAESRLKPWPLEADTCLREILRYSGILSGAQRRQVLFKVRELVSPYLTSH